ncbi:unnamed protein product, partial [Meganyctiphanes norvegica]
AGVVTSSKNVQMDYLKKGVGLQNIPNTLSDDILQKILKACGNYSLFSFKRNMLAGTCTIHYHQVQSTLRCERLLHNLSIMNSKVQVTIPYKASITLQERQLGNQEIDKVTLILIKEYIQSAEMELNKVNVKGTPATVKEVNKDNVNVNVKGIPATVKEVNKNLKAQLSFAKKVQESQKIETKKVQGKLTQKSGSKSPIRRQKRSHSRSPKRRDRLNSRSPDRRKRKPDRKNRRSGSKSPDRRKRKSSSRSPDRRKRKSSSRSPDRRYKRSRSRSKDKLDKRKRSGSPDRSRERQRKESGNLEMSSVQEKRISSRSLSNNRERANDIEIIKEVSTGTKEQNIKSSITDAHEKHNEFSAVEACQLLIGFCDKIGIIGHSLKAVLEHTQSKCGNDPHKILEILSDEETQELFIIIAGKFKRLKEETQDSKIHANYMQAYIATNFLMESTKLHLEKSKLATYDNK